MSREVLKQMCRSVVPCVLEGSWVPVESKLNVAESRQCISSVSFLMISGCPSEAELWSHLRLQVEKKQRQWPRNKKCYICNLAPTFFLTHLYEACSKCGVVQIRHEGEFCQEMVRIR